MTPIRKGRKKLYREGNNNKYKIKTGRSRRNRAKGGIQETFPGHIAIRIKSFAWGFTYQPRIKGTNKARLDFSQFEPSPFYSSIGNFLSG